MLHELIINHIYLAQSLAKSYFRIFPSFDLEELISVAYLGLVDAAHKYDSSKSKFSTYAFFRIRGELKSFINLEIIFKKGHFTLAEDTQSRNTNDNGFYLMTEKLNPQGRQLMEWYYVHQLTMKEIGEKLGMKQPRVSKLLSFYTEKLAI